MRYDLQPAPPKAIETLYKGYRFRSRLEARWAVFFDASKIEFSLGFSPVETFESGLLDTINWYLNNSDWSLNVLDGSYRRERLGLKMEDKA